ncbi:MAG: hypothetical protein K0Q94_5367 [Paenibacillus sp.]|nr:hypothetical protein [Paenibacillus sp.]
MPMRSPRTLSLFLITLFLLTGCGDRRILERTGFIQSTSHDLEADGKIKYGITMPLSNTDIKTNSKFLKTDADSAKEARIILARKTNLLLVSGQLRTALFGLSLSKRDIWEHMDTLLRDPTISDQVKVVVINGDAADMLAKNFPESPRTGKYIDRLVEKEAKGQTIPETTLYSFTRDYYDDGIDPVAPVLKDIGDSIIVDGIGLFQGGRYVDKIEPKDSLVFAFLRGNFKHGELSLDLSKSDIGSKSVMLSSLNSSRSVDVAGKGGEQRSVQLDVKVKASVLEYIGKLRLSDDKDREALERAMSDQLTRRGNELLQFLQAKKTDSLGIGAHVRNSMPYAQWKALAWQDEYPRLTIKCKIRIKIKDYGFRR